MSYPASCGTNDSIIDISPACLNDLWQRGSGANNKCTTSLTSSTSNGRMDLTLVGSTPNLQPFRTYGQPLSVVSAIFADAAQNYPILCQSNLYTEPSMSGTSKIDMINSNNAVLNGLSAQYSLLYNQYTNLLQNPPANVVATAQAALFAQDTYDNTNNVTNETAAVNAAAAARTAAEAYRSTLNNIKTDIDLIYPKIQILTTTINSSLKQILPTETANSAAIQANATNLQSKINEMNAEFKNLSDKLAIPSELDGNYEVEQIKTTSNFMKKLLYIFFAIIVVGCLVMLTISPTEGKLDMFMLGLGVIVVAYYIYVYFQSRRI